MRASATKSRRLPGWNGPTGSVETEWSRLTWTPCWTRYAPTRASTISCAASACPRPRRSSSARSAMKTGAARQGRMILVLLLALALPARPQSGDEGSIEGTVTDASGAVVPGVTLKARNVNTSATDTATTDASGLFRFLVLPVGTYEVVAEHRGFATLVQKDVVVTIGAKVNLTLVVSLATRRESVVVSGETPLI